MKDITYTNYMHGKIDCKDFETKHSANIMIFGILLLADVFKNFRKMCLKIYHLGPVKFLSDPGFPCQAALKKTEVKLYSLTRIDMILMVEKEIRGGIYHTIH